MKLKYKFDIATIADEIIAVPLDTAGEFNGVIHINDTMKDIMELLIEDKTEEELTMAMMQKYTNVTKEEMAASIHKICIGLKNEGILE